MTPYTIPPLQIDPRILPPPLRTSEPNSFAYHTLKIRVPEILREIIADNPDARDALAELHQEITRGKIRELREQTEDRIFWDAASREFIGRSWLDVPWFWAETFFYRRVLEATRFFENGIDPFRAKKQAELAPAAAPRAVANLLRGLPRTPRARFIALMHASLWGNRYDQSLNVAAMLNHAAPGGDERANLLADDSGRAWDFLRENAPARVAFIADNAGTELAMDIALIDFLLTEKIAARIDVHLKPQPFFVSDAMPRDFEATLDAFTRAGGETRALAERIRGFVSNETCRIQTHWFYPSSLFYFQLPEDLRMALGETSFVFIKGDANYRRLLGDAHWEPATPFEFATAYFPAPFVALRTLKAQVVVGLRVGAAEQLRAADAEWLVNGKRGVIQGRL